MQIELGLVPRKLLDRTVALLEIGWVIGEVLPGHTHDGGEKDKAWIA